MKFEVGSTAYIVESNRIVSKVTIVKRSGDFYTVRFGTNGGIQVMSSRLFASQEEARKMQKRVWLKITVTREDKVPHMIICINGRG